MDYNGYNVRPQNVQKIIDEQRQMNESKKQMFNRFQSEIIKKMNYE